MSAADADRARGNSILRGKNEWKAKRRCSTFFDYQARLTGTKMKTAPNTALLPQRAKVMKVNSFSRAVFHLEQGKGVITIEGDCEVCDRTTNWLHLKELGARDWTSMYGSNSGMKT
jgi:hypothetical protein